MTVEEYRDQLIATSKDWRISDLNYFLMAEGEFVTSIGTWKINEAIQWDWVQTFGVESNKLVETWLPAMATEGKWTVLDIPEVCGVEFESFVRRSSCHRMDRGGRGREAAAGSSRRSEDDCRTDRSVLISGGSPWTVATS